MRLSALLTPLLPFLAACGPHDSDDVGDAAVVGRWDVAVASRAAECDGADSGGTVYLTVPADPVDDANVIYVLGTWDVDTVGTPTDSLTGTVARENGTVFLRLWKTKLVSGAQLDGTIDHTGHFVGTLTDPAPGYDPIFVTTSCVFPAEGQVRP